MLNHPLQAACTTTATSASSSVRRSGFKLADKRTTLALCLLLLLLVFISPMRPIRLALAPATTIYVPADHPTIQYAVNNASNGDTIQVSSEKIWYEHVVVPDTINQLQILGNPANPATTIVDGTSNGTVFRLDGTRVTIKGFTIRNSGDNYDAIYCVEDLSRNDYHVISNNIIATGQSGVYLRLSNSNTITNNTFIDNTIEGLYLDNSDNNNISHNTIKQSVYGVMMIYSTGNDISNNNISETTFGVHISLTSTDNTVSFNNASGQSAAVFINSDYNEVHHNTLTNSDYGIWCYSAKYAQLYYNRITHCSIGIRLHWPTTITASYHNVSHNKVYQNEYGWGIDATNSNNNIFIGNWIQENAWGISFAGSAFNTLYHNNFVNNSNQAVSTGPSTWDNGYPSGGNYWSDYTGHDDFSGPNQDQPGSDGIGDTIYVITPGQDNYPLINKWSQHDVAIQSINPATNEAPQGATIEITVTVRNNANTSATENFQLTTKYNSSIIGTQPVPNLTPGETRILTFNWNTATTPPGNYIISAEASVVTNELNTDNNNLSDGTVKITASTIGDINHDGTVNEEDLALISQAYGSTSQSSDLNNDGIVNVSDIWILGKNYGKGV